MSNNLIKITENTAFGITDLYIYHDLKHVTIIPLIVEKMSEISKHQNSEFEEKQEDIFL